MIFNLLIKLIGNTQDSEILVFRSHPKRSYFAASKMNCPDAEENFLEGISDSHHTGD